MSISSLGLVAAATLSLLLLAGQPARSQQAKRVGKEKVSVQAKLSQDKVHAGTACAALVIISIAEGWHINSAAPADEALTGTSLEIEKKNVLDSVRVSFPPGIERAFGYTENPIEVYEGRIAIALTSHVSNDVNPGTYNIPIRLDYQACSESVCLAPATAVVELPLQVVPSSEAVHRINSELFEDAARNGK